MKRRDDAQGLRGWAVILVVLFQYYPNLFPNGFIGVDIYFVVSGFIIASILQSKRPLDVPCVVDFFSKRAQRIVPLYYASVILILLVVGSQFPPAYKEINLKSSRRAVIMASNFLEKDSDADPMHLTGEDSFSHMWAICVELQSYIIIPLAFMFQQKSGLREVTVFLTVLVLSTAFHLVTEEPLSFYCVLSRLWQFLAGVIAFFAANKQQDALLDEHQERNQKNGEMELIPKSDLQALEADMELRTSLGDRLRNICVFSPIFLSLQPIPIDSVQLRVCLTFSTAFTLYFNCEDCKALSNRATTRLAELSYALYLAHLPVYTLVELYSQYIFCPFPLGILCSFTLAEIHQQHVDRFMRSCSSTLIWRLSMCLFVAAAILSWLIEFF